MRAGAQLRSARRAALRNALGLVTLGIIGVLPVVGGENACAAAKTGAPVVSPAPITSAELEKELSQYKNIKSLEASFEQVKDLKGLAVKLKSSGSFRLRKDGDKTEVEWQVNKPGYLKLKITPERIEIFEEEGKPGKPLVDNQEAQGKILRPLYAWLSVNATLIGEQYKIFSLGKQGFRLEPKDENSPVKALRLSLDRNKLVSAVFLEERSGDEIKISFSATKVARSP